MIKYRRARALHRYYKITRFYSFLKNIVTKAAITIGVFVALLVILEIFFIDINSLLDSLVANYAPGAIFSVFLLSETFLGLLPPEIFIAWSSQLHNQWMYLLILALISYTGGILAYFIGKLLFMIPSVKHHLEHKISGHIGHLRKWGGVFVFIGAMLPIPHSVVSLACGLIKYNFRHYVMWALFRVLRFFIYAMVIFQVF
jgi:membrane protein YqaA with SNARE-associated domain